MLRNVNEEMNALKPTLAASATISGSSIAVTSFRAGSEFATKTTYKIMS